MRSGMAPRASASSPATFCAVCPHNPGVRAACVRAASNKTVHGALLGVAMCIAAGLAAQALISIAMSKLGVVVSGTGTIFASNGVVATLQRFGHSALTDRKSVV